MPSLYSISSEFVAILDNEELTEEDEARLTAVEVDFTDKVEAVLQYRQGLVGDGEAIVAEIRRLQAKRDAIVRRAEWLKRYVHETMERLNVGKVSGRTFTATIAKSPARVEVSEDAEVPDIFMRTKTIREPNKEALLECSKLGYVLPPGVKVTQSTNLRIS